MKAKILIVLSIILSILLVGFYLKPAFQEVSDLAPKLVPMGPIKAKEIVEPVVAETKKEVSIQFFGDIMLDRSVAKVMGSEGLDYIFAKDKGIFVDTNLTIANLEGPFAPTRIQTSKTIAFRFDPKLAAQLKSYGFDAFSMANNHGMDMGKKNVDFTRSVLLENSLGYFGDEYNTGPQYTYTVGEERGLSFKVAFVGLNYTEGALDIKQIKQVIDNAKSQAKFVIVNIHWGEEYKRISNIKQRNMAHQLVDIGVDAIIGHHPHVIQEVEVYKGKYIFYSLGNFIFDQYFSAETQEGASVVMDLQEDGTVGAQIFPFFSKKSQVERMVGDQKQEFFDWLQKNSRLEDKKFESLIFLEKNV
ncbi:MAG: hypothetical protein A2563_03055 [Candidatus Magasanikbacteria bacterium RIFOXYD1_FULL_40_23]|uniref:Capsule synthesis protein CapA domain-containing protein n=1 Tax=Candidatus Magasanikbacteria bacterium RIFOXYD1_FULL_40_23 TaxID=1798705 RepID=A0A1F6P957_9BACT|nr:MAG: hypothetical protein A2563_03055 [Candidatus Magasanikbacteria bacterium RIFOXYD1_FULL_40_23]